LLGDYVKSRNRLAQAVLLRPDYREVLDVSAKAEDRLPEAKAADAKLTEATDVNAAAPPWDAQPIPAALAAATLCLPARANPGRGTPSGPQLHE
jgi:hypothetical protein